MSFRTFAAAAAFALTFASVASAHDVVVTATLAAPAATARVVADSAVWNCVDASCHAVPEHAVSVHSCHDFARQSHARVTAFGSDDKRLDAGELARCNNESAATTLQASASH